MSSMLTAHIDYTSILALIMCIIILLTGGFEVFTAGNWDASGFISAYLYVLSLDTSMIFITLVGLRMLTVTQGHAARALCVSDIQIRQENQGCVAEEHTAR